MSNQRASLPLQSKVSLTLLLLIAVFVALVYFILWAVISPAFDELDREAAAVEISDVKALLYTDLDELQAVNADWSPWDDMYEYVSGRDPSFQNSHLVLGTLETLDLNLLAVYGPDGRRMWSQVLVDGQIVRSDTFNILDPENALAQSLVTHGGTETATLGFVRSLAGPMMISSMPVTRSDQSGPVAGAVVMGRVLNEARLESLAARSGADVRWQFDAAEGVAQAGLLPADDAILATELLPDIYGNPYLVLQTSSRRSIAALGSRTINTAVLFLAAAGVLATGLVFFLLRHTILRPIERLAEHLDTRREQGDLSSTLKLRRRDEIGLLADQFDAMTEDLHKASRSKAKKSLKAGSADTATEVLHNIRNALTPMVNGLERMRRSMRSADRLRVNDVTAELADPDCAPGRREKLLQYLDASFGHIEKIAGRLSEDLELTTSQAKQIEGILAEQEKFANAVRLREALPLEDVVREATNVIPTAADDPLDVDVDSHIGDVRVEAHRIGLLQVLGNIILNAYESIGRSGHPSGKISLKAQAEQIDSENMVRLTIDDDGDGFTDDVVERMFQRGYTSKPSSETTGLGLHWCANAVASMGGRIVAESDGRGQGARFHILLPAADAAGAAR